MPLQRLKYSSNDIECGFSEGVGRGGREGAGEGGATLSFSSPSYGASPAEGEINHRLIRGSPSPLTLRLAATQSLVICW